jgi:type IV pilus assembly protein PilQ
MAKVLQKEVSIHLENATLENIIFTVGQAEGINFVADKSLPAFKQTLSVNMNKVKLSEFLRYVSRNMDLQFQVGDDLIWIVDAKDPKKVQEEVRIYRLRKGFILPAQLGPPEVVTTRATVNNVTTVTEVQKMAKFVNDLAPTSPSIERAITNFFTGKYQLDYERNLIVARGTREQLEVMDKIVEEFDRAIMQVLIEARFIVVSEATFLKLGIAWETGRELLSGGRVATDMTGLALGDVGLGLEETRGHILSRRNLSATLTAIQQSGESQVLSAPRLTVVNNLPATISDGKIQYYYEEYQVKQQILERRSSSQLVPSGKPVKVTGGVLLYVLASIGGDGRTIFLALNPQVNQDVKLVPFATITDRDDTGRIVSSFDIKLPESRTQDLSTRVVVRSGQTVVMGGVLERQQMTFVESVPILGNLPIIGAAFRRRTELDKPRYLLVFVTATLLSESGEYLVFDEEAATAQDPKEPAK